MMKKVIPLALLLLFLVNLHYVAGLPTGDAKAIYNVVQERAPAYSYEKMYTTNLCSSTTYADVQSLKIEEAREDIIAAMVLYLIGSTLFLLYAILTRNPELAITVLFVTFAILVIGVGIYVML